MDLTDDYYKWFNLGTGATTEAPESGSSIWQMASYFARFNYNYDDRYLVTATGRVDGSSRFGADNKYAFFPSAALAWRASEEAFMQDIETVSNLKFRVSYGLTGNSTIGEYQSLANMQPAAEIGRASCRERGKNWVGDGIIGERMTYENEHRLGIVY